MLKCSVVELLQGLSKETGISLLEKQFGIKARCHSEFTELVCFKYDQIKSPKTHPIVQQCRGIILDSSQNWAVVSRPFDRFFNVDEHCAAEIDMTTAVAYHKLDGSLMTMYHYKGAWRVQSSGTADAAGELYLIDKSFAQLFWSIWQDNDYTLPDCWTGYCFMFEMTSPYNKVVVQYTKPELRLLGVRNVMSGQELRPELAAKVMDWSCVQSLELCDDNATLGSLVLKAAELNPLQLEGFILCDHNFNRVKIKCPAYVALHRMADGMTKLDCVKIVRTGEQAEIVAYFPEYAPMLTEMRNKYVATQAAVKDSWLTNEHLVSDKKAFAMAVKELPWAGALFTAAKLGWSDDWATNLSDAQLLKLLTYDVEAKA